MIKPYTFSICDTMTWVLDTGSPINICNSLQGLQVSESFEEGERFLNVGDGRSVPVLALGIIKLVFDSQVVILNDCHFCPTFLLNIISVGLLTKRYKISIKKNICDIVYDGVTIFFGYLNNDIYVVSWSCIMNTSSKRPRIKDVSNVYL